MRRINRCAFWLIILSCLLACAIPLILKSAQAQNRQRAEERIPGVPEGYTIIEGDIQMPIEVVNAMRSQAQLKPNAPQATYNTRLWSTGIVPFQFQTKCDKTSDCDNAPPSGCVSDANQNAMFAAMSEVQRGAHVGFVQCANNDCGGGAHILIRDSTNDTTAGPNNVCQKASKNNSAVGRQGGAQTVNIVSWGSKFIIAHELMHALGLYHEQSRPDRDSFVTVNCGNIQNDNGDCSSDTAKVNFDKVGALVYGPYDFDSVMHYDQCAFSVDCPAGATCKCARTTLTVKAPYDKDPNNWQVNMGQRAHISDLDRLIVSFLYPQPNWRFVDGTYTGQFGYSNGAFTRPYQLLATGINATPIGGVLWIQPGAYFANSLTKAIQLRAPLGGVTIRAMQGAVSDTLAAVSAASYNGELSSESIAAAFGENLASGVATATSLPLPTTLGGVTLKVKDSGGVERDAPLFFVSPGQINYLVPAGASVGPASVAVFRNGAAVASGSIPVTETAPGLFTANGSGSGVPAAYALRVRGDAQIVEPLMRYDLGQKQFVPLPIDLGPEGDLVFLILFGTGFRSATASGVTVTVSGENAEVFYAGAASGFAGLDQANVLLPRSLAGKGEVNISFTADNRSANAVTVSVR